jgi:hypothetical protein
MLGLVPVPILQAHSALERSEVVLLLRSVDHHEEPFLGVALADEQVIDLGDRQTKMLDEIAVVECTRRPGYHVAVGAFVDVLEVEVDHALTGGRQNVGQLDAAGASGRRLDHHWLENVRLFLLWLLLLFASLALVLALAILRRGFLIILSGSGRSWIVRLRLWRLGFTEPAGNDQGGHSQDDQADRSHGQPEDQLAVALAALLLFGLFELRLILVVNILLGDSGRRPGGRFAVSLRFAAGAIVELLDFIDLVFLDLLALAGLGRDRGLFLRGDGGIAVFLRPVGGDSLLVLRDGIFHDKAVLALGAVDLLADQAGILDRHVGLAAWALLLETSGNCHVKVSGTEPRVGSGTGQGLLWQQQVNAS